MDSERSDRAIAMADVCQMFAQALLESASEPDQWGLASDDGESGIELLRGVGAIVGAGRLPLLELAYVGQPVQEAEARALVEQLGAGFLFVMDPGDKVPSTLQSFLDKHCSPDAARM